MKRRLWGVAALLLLLGPAAALPQPTDEEEDAASYVFRFRGGAKVRVEGERPHGVGNDHAHGALSESDFKQAQADVEAFWQEHRRSGSPIDADVVIELFRRAKHFSVVHALLGNSISNAESVQIGQVRGDIHQQVLTRLAETGRFGDRLGVNDFGTVGNAKSDIDFTPYAEDAAGPDLVQAYRDEFMRLTRGVDPGQMDIVAHSHEAFIPDWRQTQATGDFVASLREGRRLLRANPEAYFLEGAYHQQVMGRSADGETLTWIERQGDGPVTRTASNAAVDADFFYFKPDVRQRYAWGGAVGNWHFYHAHPTDKVAQAKYLLRSLDDGARLADLGSTQSKRYAAFEKLPRGERARVIDRIYGRRVDAQTKAYFQAVMECAATIRQLKASSGNTSGPEAFRALIELERQRSPEMDEGALLDRARASMDSYGAAMLLQNNVIAARARLNDWIAPNVKSGEFRTVTAEGNLRRITIDQNKVKRLQYSAFFEIRDGLELLPDAEIERIRQENPRYANDIDILRRVIERQREMALAPDHLDGDDARAHRFEAAREVIADLQRLDKVAAEGGPLRFYSELGGTAWRRGEQFEGWMNRMLVEALPRAASGNDVEVVKALGELQKAVQATNERILSARWMSRLDKANSVIEVLKTYVREGELNEQVGKVFLYEVLSFVPGMGTVMQVQGGMQGVITLISTKVIPGYGPILLTLQVAKGTVELVGLAVFEPLRDDRILFAYQGYLPATSAGLFTPGNKERIDGRVTPIINMVDPRGQLSLEDRRAGIYTYFHDNITATLASDPNFPYTEDEWPGEWLAKEQEWLTVRIRQHVLDWWNARGVFVNNDEITAFTGKMLGVTEQEFRTALEQRLWKDYWKGREVHFRKEIQKREAEHTRLEELMAQVAAVDVGLDERKRNHLSDFRSNGELVFAHMLDGMPVLRPSLEIVAAPRVELLALGEDFDEQEVDLVPEVSLRAQVYGSTEDHPYPWTISWDMEQGGDSATFEWRGTQGRQSLEGEAGSGTGSWRQRVRAIARDAENREIARQTLDLEVEKIRIGEVEVDDGDEGQTAEGGEEERGEPGDETGVDAEALQAAEALAEAAAGRATAACDAAEAAADEARAEAERIQSSADQLAGAAEALASRWESGRAAAESALEGAAAAEADGVRLAELRDEAAALRETACSEARRIAGAASQRDRAEIFDRVRGAAARLESIKGEAQSLLSSMRAATGRIEGAITSLEGLEAEVERLSAEHADLQAEAEQSGTATESVRTSAEAARTAMAEMASQRDRVAGLLAAAEAEGSATGGGTAEALARINQSEAEVGDCPGRAEAALAQVDGEMSNALAAVARGGELLGQAQASMEDGLLDRLRGAFQSLDATLSIVEAFADSIDFRADEAALCVEMADGSMSLPISPVVPSVVGLSYGEASSLVSEAGLVAIRSESSVAASREDQAGLVARQDPAAGTKATEGGRVVLEVYGDVDRRVEVPNVVGMTVEEARGQLAQAGLNLSEGTPRKPATAGQEFLIFEQFPTAYSTGEPGSAVKVTAYGEHIPLRTVPSVVGMHVEQAMRTIEAAGFVVSRSLAGAAPSAAESFRVSAQVPLAGGDLAVGEAVSIRFYDEYLAPPPPRPEPPASPPPPRPQAPPPSPRVAEDGYCVAFVNHLPVDQSQAGEGKLKRQLATKSYSAGDYKPQGDPIHMEVRPGGAPREDFPPNKQYVLPFSMRGSNPQNGEPMAVNMPLLLKVGGTGDDCREVGQRFPSDQDPIVLDEDGRFSSTDEDGMTVTGGPLEDGWSDEAIADNLSGLGDLADLFDCFVATAVYRSADGPELRSLRRFRDQILLAYPGGKGLVALYYRNGPRLSAWLKPRPRARALIEPLVSGLAWAVDRLPEHRRGNDLALGGLLAGANRLLRAAGLDGDGEVPLELFDPLATESAVPIGLSDQRVGRTGTTGGGW